MVRLDDTEFGTVVSAANSNVQPLNPNYAQDILNNFALDYNSANRLDFQPDTWFDPQFNQDNFLSQPQDMVFGDYAQNVTDNFMLDYNNAQQQAQQLAFEEEQRRIAEQQQLAAEAEQRRIMQEEQQNLLQQRQQAEAAQRAQELALQQQQNAIFSQMQSPSSIPAPGMTPEIPEKPEFPSITKDLTWNGDNIVLKDKQGYKVINKEGLIYSESLGKWVSPNLDKDKRYNPATGTWSLPDEVNIQKKYRELWLKNAGFRDAYYNSQLLSGLPANEQAIYNSGAKIAQENSPVARLEELRFREQELKNAIMEQEVNVKGWDIKPDKNTIQKKGTHFYPIGGESGESWAYEYEVPDGQGNSIKVYASVDDKDNLLYEYTRIGKDGQQEKVINFEPGNIQISSIISGNELIRDVSRSLGKEINPEEWNPILSGVTNVAANPLVWAEIASNPSQTPRIIAGNLAAEYASRGAGALARQATDNPWIVTPVEIGAGLATGIGTYKALGMADEAVAASAARREWDRVRGVPVGGDYAGIESGIRQEYIPPSATSRKPITGTLADIPDRVVMEADAAAADVAASQAVREAAPQEVAVISGDMQGVSGNILSTSDTGAMNIEVTYSPNPAVRAGESVTVNAADTTLIPRTTAPVEPTAPSATPAATPLVPVTTAAKGESVLIVSGEFNGVTGRIVNSPQQGVIRVRVIDGGESGLPNGKIVKVATSDARQTLPNIGMTPKPQTELVLDSTGKYKLKPVEPRGTSARIARQLLPGFVEVRPGEVETGTRVGRILSAPSVEQVGKETNVNKITKIANDLKRQVSSKVNQLVAESHQHWRALGPTFKGENGNTYLKNVKPSAYEMKLNRARAKANGVEHLIDSPNPNQYNRASQIRVIERPSEYNLNEAQKRAVRALAAITERVARERSIFGIPINKLSSPENEFYQHRAAKSPSITDKVFRRGSSSDLERRWDDVADAINSGVVYRDARYAFRQNTIANLTKASNTHVRNLLASSGIGTTREMLMDAAVVSKMNSLRETLKRLETAKGVLDDKTASVISRFRTATEPDFDELQKALDEVKIGASATGKQGPNFGLTPDKVRQEITTAQAQLKAVAAEYRTGLRKAETQMATMATVPQQYAPFLQKMTFSEYDANRLDAFFSNGVHVRIPKTAGKVYHTTIPYITDLIGLLTPIKASIDISVIGMQGALLGAGQPKSWAVNVAKGFRDAFDDNFYYKWASSPKVQNASKYIQLMDVEGSEYTGNILSNIPIFKQFGKYFARFSNRIRVDAFESAVDVARRNGKVDTREMMRMGRIIDSMGGIGITDPTDVERLFFFAPRFMRSNMYNLRMALSDGSIEGQLARQYFKNFIEIGTSAVLSAAVIQGRDPMEVLDPINREALSRGEIKINPNWMTIRFKGEDVSVFSSYDSLVRLGFMLADGAVLSAKEKDPRKMSEFFAYLLSTKGSIPVKFAMEILKGETFTGEDPLSWQATVGRFLPISGETFAQNAGWLSSEDTLKQPMSLGKNIQTSLMNIAGVKSNPVTEKERLNIEIEKLGLTNADGTKVTSLANADLVNRGIIEQKFGKLQDVPKEVKESRKQSEKIRSDAAERQKGIDALYGEFNGRFPKITDAKAWRAASRSVRDEMAAKFREKEEMSPYTGPESKDKMRNYVDEYFAKLKEFSNAAGITDYDKVDAWMAANPDKAKLVNAYLDNAIKNYLSPLDENLQKDRKTIDKSGFFDINKSVWQKIKDAIPDAAPYSTYMEWRNATEQTTKDKLSKYNLSPAQIDLAAQEAISNMPVAKANDGLFKIEAAKWIGTDKEYSLYLAYRWGYYNPPKDIENYLLNKAIKNGWDK